jgi:uncharacterized membrane protein (Fun14 family)
MANVAPRACAKAFELFQAGKTIEALEIAGEVSKAEWGMGKGGIMGTKVGYTVAVLSSSHPLVVYIIPLYCLVRPLPSNQ